jgi:hypothetical protein
MWRKHAPLVDELLRTKQLIDIDLSLREPLFKILKSLIKQKRITSYQIGNGFAPNKSLNVFVNQSGIVMLVENLDTLYLAC